MPSWIDRLGWGLTAALALAFVAVFAREAASGPLDPPGTPGPTLPQVEPRQPIPPPGWNGTFPIEINEYGSYFLTRRLFEDGSAIAIDINVGEVTLDLNGFAVSANNFAPAVIDVAPGAGQVTIRNGAVYGGVSAISAPQGLATFEDLFIVTNNVSAIAIDAGPRTTLTRVQVEAGNGGNAVRLGDLSRVSDCIIDERTFGDVTAGIGIDAGTQSTVDGCTVEGFDTGIRVASASRVTNCDVRNVQTGIDAGAGSAVERCTIGVYEFEGIKTGDNAKVSENQVDFNSPAQATSCAIRATGTNNRIDGNLLINYALITGARGVCLSASGNAVHRNTFYETDWTITAPGGNDIGPLQTAAAGTSPWANITY